jgi:hypothetical protein
MMKKVLSILSVFSLMIGASDAGCGKKVTNEGTLKSYDAEKKVIVVVGADRKKAKLTITATTKGADALKDLVGKSVKVISEHKKVDSVEAEEAKKA